MSDGQREDFATMQTAIEEGGRYAFAAPRGDGKTSRVEAAILWAGLYGHRCCIVVVGADLGAANEIVESVKLEIRTNETLREDFPVPCWAATLAEDTALRAKGWTWAGVSLFMRWGKGGIVLPVLEGADGPGCVIVPRGLTGRLRGMRLKVGKRAVRPDFYAIDDPQTDESAASPAQVATRENLILGAIMGSGGPAASSAAMMPCTIIKPDDLAARFLDKKRHPDWQGSTRSLIRKWPEAQKTLWKEYMNKRREDGPETADAFYTANREAMDAGAAVDWPERYTRGKEQTAIQHAENLLCDLGEEVFAAEYQNQPQQIASGQYELTIDQILAHATDLPRLHLPERAQHLVGHADINRTGLHWCVTAFDQAMTAHVVAYGNWPPRGDLWAQNATAQVRQASIYRGLSELMGQVAAADFRRGGAQVRPSLFLIDASYEAETVHRFCEAWRGPFRCMPAIGRAAHRYRWSKATLVGRPAEQAHVQRPQSRLCPYVMANVDHWREVAQRAWLAEVGEAGGCTIHAVANPRAHVPFAEHVTAEKLAQKYETELGWRWEWTHAVGSHWDWGDALTGCWVAAALEGLSSGGVPTVRKKKVCRAVISGQISKGNEQPKGTDNEQGTKEQPEQAGTGHPKRRAVIGRGRGWWR
ncbi:MAG TPA: phage terminase large subunit family protein [Candidatus Paceibacterota bacterium]|nr:phage terminase large subunit family protein [Candidatus Paceibacterota bacterium]